MADKSAADPPPPPPAPPKPKKRAATKLELWYLDCYTKLSTHYGRPPSVYEMASYCDRSATAVHVALTSLWAKGHLAKRKSDRRYEVVP